MGSKIGGNFVAQVDTNIAIFVVICRVKMGQKSSSKAEYHTNEGEGNEKLKGLRSGSKMFSIDCQYLSLGYLEQNEFFFHKTKN